jgi:hypothetical protein
LGAVATQLLQPGDEVVSLFHRRLEHGYPTPSLDRDAVLQEALPWLQEAAGIWSRGRFGSYKVWYAVWVQFLFCRSTGLELIEFSALFSAYLMQPGAAPETACDWYTSADRLTTALQCTAFRMKLA